MPRGRWREQRADPLKESCPTSVAQIIVYSTAIIPQNIPVRSGRFSFLELGYSRMTQDGERCLRTKTRSLIGHGGTCCSPVYSCLLEVLRSTCWRWS